MRRFVFATLIFLSAVLVPLWARDSLIIGAGTEMLKQEWKFGPDNEYRSEEVLYLGSLNAMASYGLSSFSSLDWCWRLSLEYPINGRHRIYDDEFGVEVESTRLPSQESPFACEIGLGLSKQSGNLLFSLIPNLSLEFWDTGFPSFCLNLGVLGTVNYIFDDDGISYVLGIGAGYDPFQWLSTWRIRTGETTIQEDYRRFSLSIFTGIAFD